MTGEFHATVAEAMGQLPGPGVERFARVLGHGTMEVEVYAPRGQDKQQPHARDELYFVVSGSGEFVNGPGRHPFGPGGALFVPAGVEHRFEDFMITFAVPYRFFGVESMVCPNGTTQNRHSRGARIASKRSGVVTSRKGCRGRQLTPKLPTLRPYGASQFWRGNEILALTCCLPLSAGAGYG